MFRNRVAIKLNDPSLKEIRAYDLRHFFISMIYAKTRDPIYTMKLSGHKKLQTIMVYVQLLSTGEEEWTHGAAKTLDEAFKLIDAGFEYVTEMDGTKLFRKRK